jgi:hypothetical protein
MAEVEESGSQNLGTFSSAPEYRTPASMSGESEESVNEQTGTFE